MEKICFLIVALSFFVANPAISSTKQFIVGVENINYYPLYDGSGESFRGYGRALLDEFSKDKGYEFVYKPLPVARLFDSFLNTDQLDFKFPDNEIWSSDAKKDKTVLYSSAMAEYVDGVSVKPEKRNLMVEDLKTLGIIRGFTAWEFLDLVKDKKVTLDEINDYEGMLKKTILGRTDGAYSNIVVLRHRLKEMGSPDALVFANALPHTKSTYRLSTIKHPEVIEEFNAWMNANQEKVDNLKKEFGVDPEE